MTSRLHHTAACVALLLLTAAVPPASQLAGENTQRLVAIGDIHGAGEEFTAILRHTGLIDDLHRWSGGPAILVQTGDFTDRGPQVREVIDRLMVLEREADAAGGKAVVLLGNHEAMNLIGDVRDVTPAIYATFASENSEARRQEAYQAYAKLNASRTEALGRAPPNVQTKEEWMLAHPPGFIEYRDALGPEGQYGRWLRSRPTVAQVGDSIFLHGGLHPDLASLDLEDINAQAEREIRTFDQYRHHMIDRKLILPSSTFQETQLAAQLELEAWLARFLPTGPPAPNRRPAIPSPEERRHAQVLIGVLQIGNWSIVNPNGPLWFRGYAQWSSEEGTPRITQLLDRYGASRVVVGHTILSSRRVTPRFGQRVFLIDTGMLASHYQGRASALEIEQGRITAIYLNERMTLVERTSASGGRK